MSRMRSDSGAGRGRSSAEFTMVKMAVLNPMQTARVRIAVAANPRSFHSSLRANRMSRSTAPPWVLIRYYAEKRSPIARKKLSQGILVSLKTLATCLLGVLLLTSGCGKQDKKRIAVIPKGRAHLFWQSVHAGAVAASREANVDIIWNGPATETDYTGQLQIVEAMINQRVDAIALAPIDNTAMVRVVERAA